jgi:hypothetical protein
LESPITITIINPPSRQEVMVELAAVRAAMGR